MIEVHYGVVRIDGAWTVISKGMRLGRFDSRVEAEEVARRMADQAAGMPVQLHLQDERGELHLEQARRDER